MLTLLQNFSDSGLAAASPNATSGPGASTKASGAGQNVALGGLMAGSVAIAMLFGALSV